MSDFVSLEIPTVHQGAVDLEGHATWVALFLVMFSNGLRLPFCQSIQDVLYYLRLALVQLHPNAWRILICYCIVWHKVLEDTKTDYPNLTAKEFLLTYSLLRVDGNLCSFYSHQGKIVAYLELLFSRIKEWSRKFFSMSSRGWEFPTSQAGRQKFSVHAI